MVVDLLHKERAITVGDPFAASAPNEIKQVSRMTNVHLNFLENLLQYHRSQPFAPGTRQKRRRPIHSLSFC